jgi:hypothetical protein
VVYTFRRLWSSGSWWAVEVVNFTDHLLEAKKRIVPQLRISFIIQLWNSRLNCKLASGSLPPPESLKFARTAAVSRLFPACRGKCAVTARSHCCIFGRIGLTSRAASWRLPIDRSEERLALAVERFGRAKPDRLEFIRREFARGACELSREEFRDRLTHLLAEQFPDETVESLVSSRDLEHSFSGNYARGLLRRGSTHVALS